MPLRRHLLSAIAVLGVVASVAPPATADVTWRACAGSPSTQCAEVPVALDRTGAISGAVRLSVRRVPTPSNPQRSAIVALAGGPGQAATPLTADFASELAPAMSTRDLLVFDQRGTGDSGPLTCDAFGEPLLSLATTAARCAAQLGPGRRRFTTADSVQDIEDLRIAAGYERLTLYGVSYGTKVALDYAATHPQRVERLVLDSVVPPEGPDPLQRPTFGAIRRVLAELCSRSACRSVTPAPTADLRAVVRQLARRDLSGSFVTADGRVRSGTFDRSDLLRVLIDGDLNPTLRAELPAALRSARRGDRWPLTRLVARGAALTALQEQDADVTLALYAATICQDTGFPWSRRASVGARAAALRAALSGVPSGSYLPFDRATAASSSLLELCVGWPSSGPAPAAPGVLPPVPTLILAGTADLRTPLESARSVAVRIAGAQVVGVPHTGHSVLGSELAGEQCAAAAVGAFFAGAPISACANRRNGIEPVPRAPGRLASTPTVGSIAGVRGRTLAAVLLTVDDVRRQVIGATFDLGRRPQSVGGLRGGRVTVSGSTQRLRDVQLVGGVRVSGTVREDGPASLRVRGGGAAAGTVQISAGATTVVARLAGRRLRLVSSRGASANRPAALPSTDDVLRRWRLRRAG